MRFHTSPISIPWLRPQCRSRNLGGTCRVTKKLLRGVKIPRIEERRGFQWSNSRRLGIAIRGLPPLIIKRRRHGGYLGAGLHCKGLCRSRGEAVLQASTSFCGAVKCPSNSRRNSRVLQGNGVRKTSPPLTDWTGKVDPFLCFHMTTMGMTLVPGHKLAGSFHVKGEQTVKRTTVQWTTVKSLLEFSFVQIVSFL